MSKKANVKNDTHDNQSLVCAGLRSHRFESEAAGKFDELCRVVDTPFSTVSVEFLLKLHARAVVCGATADFSAKLSCVPDAAGIIRVLEAAHAAGVTSLSEAAALHPEIAAMLHDAAASVQAALGGLYSGQLDHVRATLCLPALGVDRDGCCVACSAVRHDQNLVRRLRRRSAREGHNLDSNLDSR